MQTNSLHFPFKQGLHFPQTLRRGAALQQIALSWRSQGQVNNIIAAVEKWQWQLEKVRNFTPWTRSFLLRKSLWFAALSQKETYLEILLAVGGREWGSGSISVPAPSHPRGKRLSCFFSPLTHTMERVVQVGRRWKILLYCFMCQHWGLLCFNHVSATSRIPGQPQHPFPMTGCRHAVQLHFIMLPQGCPCPHQTQFFGATGNGYNWNSDCDISRVRARLVAATTGLLGDKSGQSFLATAAGAAHELPAWVQNRRKTKAEGKKTKRKIGKKAAADYKPKWVAVCIHGNLLFPKAFRECFP